MIKGIRVASGTRADGGFALLDGSVILERDCMKLKAKQRPGCEDVDEG